MSAMTQLHETYVRATPDAVWSAVTDPEQSARVWGGFCVEATFRPGRKWRLVAVEDDRDVVEGDIETVDRPHRLVLTWRALSDEPLRDEPASRVEWTIAPVGEDRGVTRVTVRHGELALSPLTWERMRTWWPIALASLKSLLETGEALPALAVPEDGPDAVEIEANWHRVQAVTANNAVWALLDGRQLLPDEIDEVLERAYAAAHHWRRAHGATIVHRARASYLLSRVHAVCGHGELALHHADRCSELVGSAPDDMADFDHAYAYEARARALACLGRLPEARELRRRASSVRVADEQDRSIFASDLAAGPWFGLEG